MLVLTKPSSSASASKNHGVIRLHVQGTAGHSAPLEKHRARSLLQPVMARERQPLQSSGRTPSQDNCGAPLRPRTSDQRRVREQDRVCAGHHGIGLVRKSSSAAPNGSRAVARRPTRTEGTRPPHPEAGLGQARCPGAWGALRGLRSALPFSVPSRRCL